jgi:cytochrome c oxidase cbb3-type subunit 3
MSERSTSRRFGIAALLAAVLVVAVCSWSLAQTDGRTRSGQQIYEDTCFRCHGIAGRGDGPDAAGLIVPPANLQRASSRSKSDAELLIAISYGIAFSPMHGWRGRLSDEEMTEVVAYIRTVAPYMPAL